MMVRICVCHTTTVVVYGLANYTLREHEYSKMIGHNESICWRPYCCSARCWTVILDTEVEGLPGCLCLPPHTTHVYRDICISALTINKMGKPEITLHISVILRCLRTDSKFLAVHFWNTERQIIGCCLQDYSLTSKNSFIAHCDLVCVLLNH